jgi:hypothetical protein
LTASAPVVRVPPGRLPADAWALVPETLAFRGAAFAHESQPALVAPASRAVLWLALDAEDLVLLGPYGSVEAYPALVAAARESARETGRSRLVASVRNDEMERFECLQRLGFVLVEVRIGALSAGDDPGRDEGRMWGDIAARDELVLALPVRPH